MKRSIVKYAALVAVLAAMTLCAGVLKRGWEKKNPRHDSVYSPVDKKTFAPDKVSVVGIYLPEYKIELQYKKDGEFWRMPMYRNAIAQGELIQALIKDVSGTYGIEVDTSGKDKTVFGINENSPVIKLYDSKGDILAQVICGNQLPGQWGNDSYVSIPGSEKIYHINGNPASKLVAQGLLPPMVDPKVIPSALAGMGEIVSMSFDPPSADGVERIERRPRKMSDEEMNSMPPQFRMLEFHDWFSFSGGAEIKLNEQTGDNYANFIRNLTFNRIPREEELSQEAASATGRKLMLTFMFRSPHTGQQQGPAPVEPPKMTHEYIELRGIDGRGNRFIYFSGTKVIATIGEKKAEILFPPLVILQNIQPSPSVFDRAAQEEITQPPMQ